VRRGIVAVGVPFVIAYEGGNAMERNAKPIAELLKVLGNENRLLILCRLIKGPRTVGELGAGMPKISQSALSQHLALLKASGILSFTKAGQHVTYAIADHRVEAIMDVLKAHYCEKEEGMP
jgi:DNA-binding transcriptional ArsR family regulator